MRYCYILLQTFEAKKTFFIKTLLELIQDVEIETALGTDNSRMLGSCKLQLATLFLNEEILSPMMILEWIIAGCAGMPPLPLDKFRFNLGHLMAMKADAECLLSRRFDYAKFCATKEQPLAYAPPQRRNSVERTWRTVGTQTTAFDLADWAQFRNFIRTTSEPNSTQ